MATEQQKSDLLECAPALFEQRYTPRTWRDAKPIPLPSGGWLDPDPDPARINCYKVRS